MVENDTAAVGSTGKYVSEHAFGMIDMQIRKPVYCQKLHQNKCFWENCLVWGQKMIFT